MSTFVQLAPELAVLITLMAVLVTDIAVARSRSTVYSIAVCGLLTAFVLTLYLSVGLDGSTLNPNDLVPSLRKVLIVDSLSLFLKGVVLLIGLLTVAFSRDSFEEEKQFAGEYYLLLLVATLGEMLAISSRELLTFFIAFELLSLPLYLLAGLRRYSSISAEAGLKYFVTGALSSAFLLYGISWVYGSLRTTFFSEMTLRYSELGTVVPNGLFVGLLLMTVAFAFKVAAAPFHNWAPDVYSGAPTTVVAYLSTAPKVAMVGVMLRFYWTGLTMASGPLDFHVAWTSLFGGLALFSMTVGNLSALSQTDLKRMMAYSGVAQIGYLMLGLASCWYPRGFPQSLLSGAGFMGISATIYYVAVYAIANLAVWAILGIVEKESGTTQLSGMDGLAQRNPFCAFVLTMSLMSLAGMPPLAGFFGKLYLFRAVYRTQLPFLVAFGIVNSAISLFYYFKILRAAYFSGSAERPPFALTVMQKLALAVCLLITVGLGIDHRLIACTELIAQQFIQGAIP